MFSIGKNSKHPDDAAKLINFLLNDKVGIENLGLARGVTLRKNGRNVLAPNGTLVDTDLSVAGLAQINVLPKKLMVSPYFETPQLFSLFVEKIELMDQGNKSVEEARKTLVSKGVVSCLKLFVS